jgi:hypothetical protein
VTDAAAAMARHEQAVSFRTLEPHRPPPGQSPNRFTTRCHFTISRRRIASVAYLADSEAVLR